MNNLILFSFLGVIALFSITLIFQLNMFKITQKRKFNFKNELPFELTEGTSRRFLKLQYLFHGLISLLLLVYGFAFAFKDGNNLFFYDIMLLSGLTVAAFTYFLVFFLKIDNVKFHIIVLLLYVFALFTSFLALGLNLHFSPFSKINENSFTYIFIALGYVVAGVIIGLILNPKLAKWPYMDKITQQDETVIIMRPKTFILALYEWIFVFLHLAFLVISLLSLFL
ncbi:MAG TPA: hypothetical protein VFD05_01845 [Bacilli bacterium]|nr:hypothetical protein [Bacilli bacterium]